MIGCNVFSCLREVMLFSTLQYLWKSAERYLTGTGHTNGEVKEWSLCTPCTHVHTHTHIYPICSKFHLQFMPNEPAFLKALSDNYLSSLCKKGKFTVCWLCPDGAGFNAHISTGSAKSSDPKKIWKDHPSCPYLPEDKLPKAAKVYSNNLWTIQSVQQNVRAITQYQLPASPAHKINGTSDLLVTLVPLGLPAINHRLEERWGLDRHQPFSIKEQPWRTFPLIRIPI